MLRRARARRRGASRRSLVRTAAAAALVLSPPESRLVPTCWSRTCSLPAFSPACLNASSIRLIIIRQLLETRKTAARHGAAANRSSSAACGSADSRSAGSAPADFSATAHLARTRAAADGSAIRSGKVEVAGRPPGRRRR